MNSILREMENGDKGGEKQQHRGPNQRSGPRNANQQLPTYMYKSNSTSVTLCINSDGRSLSGEIYNVTKLKCTKNKSYFESRDNCFKN